MLDEKTLSHEAFIITNGEAYLFAKESKSDQLLIKLEKGDMLGKLPFYDIGQEPHCATVMASEDLETQKINTDNIMKEYARLPRVLRNMINNASMLLLHMSFPLQSFQYGTAQMLLYQKKQ